MADDTKPIEPSAPPTGANPAATPHVQPKPGADAAATAKAAAATGATPAAPAAAAHAARPAVPPKPAPVIPDLAGRTTNAASPGGQAARVAAPAPATAKAATRDPDDT